MADELTLVQAWVAWSNQSPIEDHYLWGQTVRWWARAGKIVGLIAALTILAEIIGVERLREFSNDVKLIQDSNLIIAPAKFLVNILVSVVVDSKNVYAVLEMNNIPTKTLQRVLLCLAIVIALFLSILVTKFAPSPELTVAHFVFYVFFLVTVFIPGVILFVVFTLLAPLLILLHVTNAIAWLLSLRALDKIIKIGSVVLLLTGFHFDLLGS